MGYTTWAQAIRLTADLLARELRELQLVAAVPIPATGSTAHRDLLEFLLDGGYGPLASHMSVRGDGIASAFVQLVYPWVKTAGSRQLPEQLEMPDAVLVGVLARNALLRGAFRSAAGLSLAGVYEVFPSLRRDQLLRSLPVNPVETSTSHTLLERVSLLGPTPRGLEVLSDVTTSLNEGYRLASVNRLVSLLIRAARRLGEDITFEPSGGALWGRIRDQLSSLLLSLWHAGALRGASPDEAFNVRCDRSTMTQNDIDNGRVIVVVQFDPAIPIEQMTVVLMLAEGGQVSLVDSTMP
jgi:phage tail sheath protein FI